MFTARWSVVPCRTDLDMQFPLSVLICRPPGSSGAMKLSLTSDEVNLLVYRCAGHLEPISRSNATTPTFRTSEFDIRSSVVLSNFGGTEAIPVLKHGAANFQSGIQ